jgi:hypothetical protein
VLILFLALPILATYLTKPGPGYRLRAPVKQWSADLRCSTNPRKKDTMARSSGKTSLVPIRFTGNQLQIMSMNFEKFPPNRKWDVVNDLLLNGYKVSFAHTEEYGYSVFITAVLEKTTWVTSHRDLDKVLFQVFTANDDHIISTEHLQEGEIDQW